MATLYTYKESNIAKTWFLMAFFLGFIIALGFLFSQVYNDQAILYGAIILSLVMNITSYWFSDSIALSMSHAKLASREEYFDLYTTLENLSITAGLPMPKVYVIQDPAPNAFATGRNAKHAAVAVTSGLLNMMNKTELEGVLAHELSHVGNRDILVSSVAVVLAGVVAMLSNFFLRMTFQRGGDGEKEGKNPIFLILAIVSAVLAPIAATLIQLAISRRREFLADSCGALLTRYPEGLASALEKIGQYDQPMQYANNATAHLFLSNPFGPSAGKSFFAKIFMTHPPLAERIAILRGEQNNKQDNEHNKK